MGKINREGEGGQIWWMYFVYVYENRIMKLVEVVLRRGRRGRRENDEGMNLIEIHYKHICKRHNETPLYNYYMLIKM
jgi:hypothetical protein